MSTDHCCPAPAADSGYLGAGGSALVFAIDESRVLKKFIEPGKEQECRALDRLNPHPNIVQKITVQNDGVILERGESLRTILGRATGPSLVDRLDYAKQAAAGLDYIHKSGIVHADVGPHNMIVIGKRLAIIDFEGCVIDGEIREGALYEWCSYRPLHDEHAHFQVNIATDIFAYGCTLYELMVGHQPHHDLLPDDNRAYLSRERWSDSIYPDIANLPLNDIIMGCWTWQFQSMLEVIEALHSWTIAGSGHDPILNHIRKSCDTEATVSVHSEQAHQTLDAKSPLTLTEEFPLKSTN